MPCIKLLLLFLIIRMCRNKLYLIENEKGTYKIDTEKTKLMSNDRKSDHHLDLGFPERTCQNEIIELNNKIKILEKTVTNLKKAKEKEEHDIGGKNVTKNHNAVILKT